MQFYPKALVRTDVNNETVTITAQSSYTTNHSIQSQQCCLSAMRHVVLCGRFSCQLPSHTSCFRAQH